MTNPVFTDVHYHFICVSRVIVVISLLELVFTNLFAVPFLLTNIKILICQIIDLTFEQGKTYYFRNNIALLYIMSILIYQGFTPNSTKDQGR